MDMDIREMSFQNVLDQILKPAGVKVGGFPEEIFLDLDDEEKEKWSCNICYLIVNECRQCDNKHLFCQTCVFAWSMTYGENSQKCPLCRHDQNEYKENKDVNRSLQDKKVLCPENACTFKAPLKIFLMHSHGKQRFSNNHVDFESLRPRRPLGSRILVLPTLQLGGPRTPRGMVIRSQLQQSRMMINQMMLLLHLEMQLRQQAFTTLHETQQSDIRTQRLDEVIALNEQLNEVGTILSNLLNTPLHRGSGRHTSTDTSENSTVDNESALANALVHQLETNSNPPSRLSDLHVPRVVSPVEDSESDSENDSDENESSFSSLSTIVNRTQQNNESSSNVENFGATNTSSTSRSQVPQLSSTIREGQSMLDAARQRRLNTQSILSINNVYGDQVISNDEPIRGSQSQTGLLSRRQDQSQAHLIGASESYTVIDTTHRIDENSNNSQLNNQPSSSSSLQLPTIRGADQTSPTNRSVSRSTSRSMSEESYETIPSTVARSSRIPPGSSALNDVMRDLREEQQPQQIRTTTTTTTENGVTISVTSSGPYRRHETSSSQRVGIARGPLVSDQTTALENSRQSSSLRTEAPPQQRRISRPSSVSLSQSGASDQNGRTTPFNRNITNEVGERPEGSILPASLYRRRQTSFVDTSIGNNDAQTERQLNQRQPLAHRIPGHSRSQVTRSSRGTSQISNTRPRVNLNASSNTSSRYLQSRNSDGPSVNSSDTSVRPRVNGDRLTTRREIQSNRLSMSRPAPNHSQPPRTPRSIVNNMMQNQPTTSDGVVRSRRRSEIHQQMLMRKNNK